MIVKRYNVSERPQSSLQPGQALITMIVDQFLKGLTAYRETQISCWAFTALPLGVRVSWFEVTSLKSPYRDKVPDPRMRSARVHTELGCNTGHTTGDFIPATCDTAPVTGMGMQVQV
jgi:hypothetical protein